MVENTFSILVENACDFLISWYLLQKSSMCLIKSISSWFTQLIPIYWICQCLNTLADFGYRPLSRTVLQSHDLIGCLLPCMYSYSWSAMHKKFIYLLCNHVYSIYPFCAWVHISYTPLCDQVYFIYPFRISIHILYTPCAIKCISYTPSAHQFTFHIPLVPSSTG